MQIGEMVYMKCMFKMACLHFSCATYSMGSSLVKFENVHVGFSPCFEIDKRLLARLDKWKKWP